MSATLSIADIAGTAPETVSLSGTGVAQATTSVKSLTFGTQGLNNTSAAKTVSLTNNDSTALTLYGNTITGTNATDFSQSATTCGASLAAHSSCNISVTFTPSVSGAETATLNITDSASNSPQTVSLTGTGVAQFTLSAASINFGNETSGSASAAKSVTLTNNTSAAVSISSIGIGGTNPANFTQSATRRLT
jgi:Abnormal spindle-like microcephaly-assoc'd, ASPM-SPD-2-Hydin